jgi:RND superfamily putative drug exporter
MNLLTVGAAYGALVAVFQWGWLDWTPFFDSAGYVNSFSLPYVLAVVFGLSMDYEVFLLSRVRERYMATGDNRQAVAEALRSSAGTITSAAAIMVAVFLIFAFVSVPSVQEIGVGLAVAIALDATVVRLVLVPASMQLLGKWNWWMPGRGRVPSEAAARPT